MMQKINIVLRGIDVFDESEKLIVNRLLNEYSGKIQRMINDEASLNVQFKVHDVGGILDREKIKIKSKKKRWNIDLKLNTSMRKFEASAEDWDLARTIHEVMKKLMTEMEHKFHSNDQHDKIRRPQNIRTRKN